MTESRPSPADSSATTFEAVWADLLARAPEQHMQPRLQPVRDLCDVLGYPQRAYPVIHITGTNGKTSTARYIEALLREMGLRTGRYTSPHLQHVTERICIDGVAITPEAFAHVADDIAVQVAIVDGGLRAAGEPALTFFEILTVMAYAAFADAPVDVAIIEVGLGGSWDATNVADASVAVFTPISLDHTHMLGDTIEAIAAEKAGIIKADSYVVSAAQPQGAAVPIVERARELGCPMTVVGRDIDVFNRVVAVGGQQFAVRTPAGEYHDIYLPSYGEHQAANAALAIAACEAFVGGHHQTLGPEVVSAAFHNIKTPGRLELVRPSPAILLDAAHNPGGLATTLTALGEAFRFTYLVALVGVLDDKDAATMLELLEPVVDCIVVTQSDSPRAIPTAALADLAMEIFDDEDRVHAVAELDEAIAVAANLAEAHGDAAGGVLITGSITVVAQARALLRTGAVDQ